MLMEICHGRTVPLPEGECLLPQVTTACLFYIMKCHYESPPLFAQGNALRC